MNKFWEKWVVEGALKYVFIVLGWIIMILIVVAIIASRLT